MKDDPTSLASINFNFDVTFVILVTLGFLLITIAGLTILTKLNDLKLYSKTIAVKIFHLYQEMNASIINLNCKSSSINQLSNSCSWSLNFFIQPTECNVKLVTIYIQVILHQLLHVFLGTRSLLLHTAPKFLLSLQGHQQWSRDVQLDLLQNWNRVKS